MRKSIILLLLASCGSVAYPAAFQNLGFDEGNTNHIVDGSGTGYGFYGPAAEMLPGWTLTEFTGVTGVGQ